MSNVKWICEELMLEVKYGCAGLNGCCHGLIRPAALGNADLVTWSIGKQPSMEHMQTRALFKNNSTFRTLKNQDMVKKYDPVSD